MSGVKGETSRRDWDSDLDQVSRSVEREGEGDEGTGRGREGEGRA